MSDPTLLAEAKRLILKTLVIGGLLIISVIVLWAVL